MNKEYKRYQEGVIRSILARPEEIGNIVDYVDSGDFEDINFKLIYESIIELYLEKQPISLPGIVLKVGDAGAAIDSNWLFNLGKNMAQWIQAAPPETWAKLLKKESAKAKAENVLKLGLTDINKKENNPLSIMDIVSNNLSQISVDATSGELFDINDALNEFENETKEMLESGGTVASISSAYPTIDYYTQGWGATHLITIGARTGIGKSVFAINNVVAAMAQGKTVLFFSLEMTRREVISRIIASLSYLPIQKIEKAAKLTEEENKRQMEAIQLIRNSNLKIDTNPHVTVEYIKRAAIKQAQSEDGLDFIVIDYLQLIANDSKNNRQEAVADVSRNMKILAKELNVPVMVLVQLNRERRDEDGDNTPKIYDIRESGAIAQDSNVVILIDRKLDEDTEIIDPKATFIIAKNRQGESNKYITVRTRLESSLFIDDNLKGQEVLQEIEDAIEKDGDYEVNLMPKEDYSSHEEFDDLGMTEEDLSNLFNSDEVGFGDDLDFGDTFNGFDDDF